MYNDKYLFSIDPGEQGALTIFNKGKWITTIDYNLNDYYKIFKEYNNFVVGIETIQPYPNRINQFGSLRESVGKIEGILEVCGNNYILIPSGLRTIDWKRPYKGLVKPKGEKWPEYEEKIRCIELCKELYPKIDIPFIKEVHHKNGTTTKYYKDGRADSCMIGDYILNFIKLRDK